MTGARSPVAVADLPELIAAARIPRVCVEARVGEGWVRADALARGEGLDPLLERVSAWAETGSAQVAGALFLDAYAWSLTGAAAAGVLLADALPELRPDAVHARFGDNGRTTAVALSDGLVRADGEAALLSVYREALVEHLRPLVDRLHGRCRRARAAFWRNAGDMAAYTLAWCGRALDDPARGAALARRLLEPASPLGPPRAFRVQSRDGQQRLTCLRHGCCLWLRTPRAEVCAGCPVRRASGSAA